MSPPFFILSLLVTTEISMLVTHRLLFFHVKIYGLLSCFKNKLQLRDIEDEDERRVILMCIL
jgi:hypothetical protein